MSQPRIRIIIRQLSTQTTRTPLPSSPTSPPSSPAGLIFFGGLCLSTFGLGCWQTKRYYEKIEMVSRRLIDIQSPPSTTFPPSPSLSSSSSSSSDDTNGNEDDDGNSDSSFRRYIVRGRFRHEEETLIGPRGPPPGALAASGPMSGRGGQGGMSVSPQGYFVITPLIRNDGGKILVNRGWVPRQYVEKSIPWRKPTGDIVVVGVTGSMEQPRYLSPRHTIDEISQRRLFWIDRSSLEEATGTYDVSPVPLLTECLEDDGRTNDDFPVTPDATTVREFKVTPATHVGYAVTWFGLSGAGMIMTRKLLTKGR